MSDWDVLSLIHAKLIGCSNDAVATFWRVVTWARGPGAHARPGFVNRAQLRHLSGGISKKRFDQVVAELVDAGKPQHDHGLLDPADGGWWVHDFDHYGRDVDIIAPLTPMPVASPAVSSVSEARAAAGRAGGLRSAAVRLATKQTAQPPKQPPEAKPGRFEANSKQTAEANSGSSFQSRSGSGLETREITKENPHPKDLVGQRAREVCFEDEDVFWKLDLGERAALITESPELASTYKPHRWPEVVDVVRAFAMATGRPRSVVAYDRDTGVQAVVALLAAFELDRLLAIIPKAVTSPWWLERAGRGLCELSLRVVEIALENDAEAAQSEARIRSYMEIAESAAPVRKASPSSPPPPILLMGRPS